MIGDRVFEFRFSTGKTITAKGANLTAAFSKAAAEIGPDASDKLLSSRDITPKRKRTRLRLHDATT